MGNKIYIAGIGDNLIERTAELLMEGQKDADLSHIGVVFPGMRPGIYLLKYLTSLYKNVYLPPVRFSMESFIEYTARMKTPELFKIDMIDADYILYRIVKGLKENYISKYTKDIEHWDMFFPWGIKLAGAVDEVDIAQVTEEKIKETEVLESLDESIIPYARALWTSMSSIRENYHKTMRDRGWTTRGMDYQYAVEWVKEKGKDVFSAFDRVYFVGFNALNKSEEFIIKTLRENGKAEVIWQSDMAKIHNARRGSPYYFHRKIWESWDMPELVSISPSIPQDYEKYHFYEGFNTHSQVSKVKEILNDGKPYKNTAVVLPSGESLIPILEEVVLSDKREFNITMGYPLARTPIYTLFEFIFRAQESREKDTEFYYYRDYLSVMKHPYIKSMYPPEKNTAQKIEASIDKMNRMFIDIEKSPENIGENFCPEEISAIKEIHKIFFDPFQRANTLLSLSNAIEIALRVIFENTPAKAYNPAVEYFAGMIEILDNVRRLEISNKTFDKKVLFNIMRGYAGTKEIHFTGEPLKGIQIMGMLETRGLKFDRVIVLDANEGIVPGIYKYDPILPIGLRRVLGLGDYKDRESLYAYNFFRLVQGASDVHIIYNTGEDSYNKNIRSRFVEQLIWEIEKEKGDISEDKKEVLSFNLKISSPGALSIKKTEEISEILKARRFSSSSLDTYIKCPLKFYYRYVLGLSEVEEVEEAPEMSEVGKIIHTTLQRFFSDYKDKPLIIENKADNNMLHLLKETIEEHYGEIGQSGTLFILYEIARYRLKSFLRKERERIKETPIEILELEQSYGYKEGKPGIDFNINPSSSVVIGGRIDRVDRIPDGYLIVDYKTGGVAEKPSVRNVLEQTYSEAREFMKKYIKSTQLPLYILLYTNSGKDIDYKDVDAGLYMIQNASLGTLFGKKGSSKAEFMEKFVDTLKELFKEMLNTEIPFEPDAGDERYCGYCPFSAMCRK